MEAIKNFFENIQPLQRSAMLVGGLAFFWLVENAFPLFKFQYNKWKHGGLNIFFTLTTIIINLSLAWLLLLVSNFTATANFGILNYCKDWPLWLSSLVGLLLLDLVGAYIVHFLEHKIKFLWQFHIVHHTDQQIDTTTANRHHPGESVVRFLFTCLAVLISGAPMWLVLVYQSLSLVFSQFNHSNFALPKKLEQMMGWVIVTPDQHHVHHHFEMPYTDSNYGNIFSIWDRLFGTFMHLDAHQIKYGLDTHMAEDKSVKIQLKLPFEKYRSR